MKKVNFFQSIKLSSSIITSGHLLAGQIFIALGGILVSVLSARSMGPSGRGELAFLLQIAYIANIFCIAGIDRSYPATASVSLSPKTATIEVFRLVAPNTLASLILYLPIVFILRGLSYSGLVTFFALSATAFSLMGITCLRVASIATNSGHIFVRAVLLGELTFAVIAIILSNNITKNPNTWLAAYGLAFAPAFMIAWIILRKTNLINTETYSNLTAARKLGLRLLPATLATLVMLRIDRLLLPWLGSYDQLGFYIVVATFSELIIWPIQSYVDAHIPHWHRLFLSGTLKRRTTLIVAVIYGAISSMALIFAVKLLLVPVCGPEFRQSVSLALPLAAGSALYAVGRVAVGLSLASERPRAILSADIPAMAISLLCYIILIPRYGAMGAAIGSAIAYSTGAVLTVVLCVLPYKQNSIDLQTSTEPTCDTHHLTLRDNQ